MIKKHNGVTYDKKCFEDSKCRDFRNEWNGSTLLKIAFKLIRQLKEKYDVKYITLTDNSQKYCRSGKIIDLDSFLMLTTGNTWHNFLLKRNFSKKFSNSKSQDLELYGKYGFVPFDSTHENTDKLNLKDYIQNQQILTNTLLKNTNIKKIILKAILKYKLNFSIKEINEILTKYEKKK